MRGAGPLMAAVLLMGGAEIACRYAGGFVQQNYDALVPHDLTPAQVKTVEAILHDRPRYLTLSPTLGWTIHPGGYSANGLYRANVHGVRADHDHDPLPHPTRVRLLAFGDSYTHGDEVVLADTWGERLNAADPRFEVVNAGVPATSIDHALLRYDDLHGRLETDVVLIGFMAENINRLLSVYWPYYMVDDDLALAKPRFTMEGRRLILQPSPIRTHDDLERLLARDPALFAELRENDYWYRTRSHRGPEDALHSVRLAKMTLYYGRRRLGRDAVIDLDGTFALDSTAGRIASAVLDVFCRRVLARGALPVVVFFPNVISVEDRPQAYEPMLERLRADGRHALDAAAALREPRATYGITDEWLAGHSHYPPPANDAIGRWLGGQLAAMGLTDRAAVRAAIRTEHRRHRDKRVVFARSD